MSLSSLWSARLLVAPTGLRRGPVLSREGPRGLPSWQGGCGSETRRPEVVALHYSKTQTACVPWSGTPHRMGSVALVLWHRRRDVGWCRSFELAQEVGPSTSSHQGWKSQSTSVLNDGPRDPPPSQTPPASVCLHPTLRTEETRRPKSGHFTPVLTRRYSLLSSEHFTNSPPPRVLVGLYLRSVIKVLRGCFFTNN